MNIKELNSTHVDDVRPLFSLKNYMGVDPAKNYFVEPGEFVNLYHETFSQSYLTGLNNYKAFGAFNKDGIVEGIIAFYISLDDPAWYGTQVRSNGNKKVVQDLLDTVIAYNEEQGRYKFYTLWSTKHSKLLRRFAFSEETNKRYDYVDEMIVPARTKCLYTNYWHILFNRILIPTDTVVRCTFLKNEYRDLPVGGNI